jgi:hypothetical protein
MPSPGGDPHNTPEACHTNLIEPPAVRGFNATQDKITYNSIYKLEPNPSAQWIPRRSGALTKNRCRTVIGLLQLSDLVRPDHVRG